MKDEGYRWKYRIERKKRQDAEKRAKAMEAALVIHQRAHAKATEAWVLAEDKLAKVGRR